MKSDIQPELGVQWNKVRMLEKIAMILAEIRDELKTWSIIIASNAEKKRLVRILQKNIKYAQDAQELTK